VTRGARVRATSRRDDALSFSFVEHKFEPDKLKIFE
jgi:hypothetical protein